MKKFLMAAVTAGALLVSGTAAMAEAVKLQLKWVTQAQFAGYYVAAAKGFYKEAGLDVTILPGGPDINPQQVLAGGGADVVVDWMPSALATREKGSPVVNIAQPFKSSGMMLTCRKETGITKPEDFKGRTLGVWFFGNEYPFLSWMSQLGIPTTGGADGVTVIKQGFNVDPLIQKQADCISTMTYNEYWQVIDAGIPPTSSSPSSMRTWVSRRWRTASMCSRTSSRIRPSSRPWRSSCKASMKGWDYARANGDEAAQIVLDNDASGAQTIEHQKRMMSEVNKLTEGSDGALDVAAAERTVETLMKGGSDPVISKKPEGAWTSVVTDKAKSM
jgi:NitT/TauT family transport system substrate-binding protein